MKTAIPIKEEAAKMTDEKIVDLFRTSISLALQLDFDSYCLLKRESARRKGLKEKSDYEFMSEFIDRKLHPEKIGKKERKIIRDPTKALFDTYEKEGHWKEEPAKKKEKFQKYYAEKEPKPFKPMVGKLVRHEYYDQKEYDKDLRILKRRGANLRKKFPKLRKEFYARRLRTLWKDCIEKKIWPHREAAVDILSQEIDRKYEIIERRDMRKKVHTAFIMPDQRDMLALQHMIGGWLYDIETEDQPWQPHYFDHPEKWGVGVIQVHIAFIKEAVYKHNQVVSALYALKNKSPKSKGFLERASHLSGKGNWYYRNPATHDDPALAKQFGPHWSERTLPQYYGIEKRFIHPKEKYPHLCDDLSEQTYTEFYKALSKALREKTLRKIEVNDLIRYALKLEKRPFQKRYLLEGKEYRRVMVKR